MIWNLALGGAFLVMLLAPSAITLIGRKREDEYATLEADVDQMPPALPASASAPEPDVAEVVPAAAAAGAVVAVAAASVPAQPAAAALPALPAAAAVKAALPAATAPAVAAPAAAVYPDVAGRAHGPEWVTVRAVEPPKPARTRSAVEEAEEEARVAARIAAQANAAALHAAARAALARAVAAEEIAEVARLEAEAASMAAASAREKWTRGDAAPGGGPLLPEPHAPVDFQENKARHRAA